MALWGREFSRGLEAQPSHSVSPHYGSRLADGWAETCCRPCGPAPSWHRRHPEQGRDIQEAAQPFRASAGLKPCPSREDAFILGQESEAAQGWGHGEGGLQGERCQSPEFSLEVPGSHCFGA